MVAEGGGTRLERRVLRDFRDPAYAQEVLQILADLPVQLGYSISQGDLERTRAAIVILANGRVEEFIRALDVARRDYRNVLMAAGLANEDWASRMDEMLGPVDPRSGK